MNYGGDAADQIIRYSLEGTEVILKLTGSAAKNFAVFAAAVLQDQKKTRGKTYLNHLLTAGKPLKFFLIPEDRAKEFAEEAKARGLLFVPVKNKKQPGKIELAVWAEDAAKVNRVLDNMSLDYLQADTGAQADVEVSKQPEQIQHNGSARETELVQVEDGKIPIEIGEQEDLFNVGFTQAPELPLEAPAQRNPSELSCELQSSSLNAETKEGQQELGVGQEPSANEEPAVPALTADELRKQGKKPSVKKELEGIKNGLKENASAEENRSPQRQHSTRKRKKNKQRKGR